LLITSNSDFFIIIFIIRELLVPSSLKIMRIKKPWVPNYFKNPLIAIGFVPKNDSFLGDYFI
jgi:hypothetical protein